MIDNNNNNHNHNQGSQGYGENPKINNQGQSRTRNNNSNGGWVNIQINGGYFRILNQGRITYHRNGNNMKEFKGQNKDLGGAIYEYGKV